MSGLKKREVSHIDYTITEFIDNRLNQFFSNRALYAASPFTVDDLRDCLLMTIIKDAYAESEKKQSLRANRGSDADDVRMRDSRNLAYAQHYRNIQYEDILKRTNIRIPELLPENVESMKDKIDGHKLTEMQYYELNTIADHPICKAIVSKRICDVKKISNETFIDYMNDYDKLTQELRERLDGDDEDVIFATIALFTLEWKYNVELFYACAVEAEKNNTKDIPKHRLATLCADLTMPMPPGNNLASMESRFVLHRKELIDAVYNASEEDWEEIYQKLYQYFIAKYHIESEIVHKWSMPEYFYTHIPRSKWAEFFREHYDLRKMYVPKEWTNKRIRYVRSLYQTFVVDMETPKL